jgi:hypothetical protein
MSLTLSLKIWLTEVCRLFIYDEKAGKLDANFNLLDHGIFS